MNQQLIESMQLLDSASFFEKKTFYEVKRKILKEFGTLEGYGIELHNGVCPVCHGTRKRIFRVGSVMQSKVCTSCNGTGSIKTRHIKLVYTLAGAEFRLSTNETPELKQLGILQPQELKAVEPNESYKCLFALLIHFDEPAFNKLMEKEIVREKFLHLENKVFELLKEINKAA